MATTASDRKRRRRTRRRQDKPPISARLVLDDQIKGDVGVLSPDLFHELFPNHTEEVAHIALAPWTPLATPSDAPWSVVPVRPASNPLHPTTVHFSPSSSSLQRFAVALQRLAPSKLAGHRSGIDVLILDAAPIPLDTVYVSLEGELSRRLEAGEGTFYRDHPTAGHRGKGLTEDDKLAGALRYALSSLSVVHTEDLFPLPLPPHPVTHIPANPGKIVLCEPVAQGVLTDATKIILMRGRGHGKRARLTAPAMPASRRAINGIREEEDDEGATTDQFYSAAEERDRSEAPSAAETETATETETETEMSELDRDEGDVDELSDDSMDDMISLQAPMLPASSASGVSTMQPGSPMTVGTIRGRRTNGIATPGSVFSNMTSMTARPDRPRGRLFKAQGLMRGMPADLLHPKPAPEDDDEARVYVHVSSLPKIGCFSGDWVRLEAASEPPVNGFGAFGLGSFGQQEVETTNWRPVRVYGLPEGYAPRPMTRIPSARHGERKLSFFASQVQPAPSPTAYASPILLANLEDASYLRIAPLKRSAYQGKGTLPRFTSASRPPYARDITVHHVRTPVSAERAYQTAVLGGLKHYFASKTRLVRSGDLIAVPVDAQLGRALQEMPGAPGGGSEVDDVMALTTGGQNHSAAHIDGVAWFKIGHIRIQKADEDEDSSAEAFWGNVACIDSSSVGMHGSGFQTSRIPGTRKSTWQYYLGLRKLPLRDPEGPPAALPPPERDQQQQSYVSPLRHQLRQLLAAATSKRAIALKMPPVAILLTSTHRNIGKSTLAAGACGDIGLHTFTIDAFDILSEGGNGGGGSDVKTEGFLRTRAERAMSCGPDCCGLLIRHVEALTADRIEVTLKEILDDTRVLIATTNEVDKVPDGVRALFTHELEMGAPDEKEREAILRNILDDRGLGLEPSIDLNSVALKTAALVAGDLVDVVDRASAAQQNRLETLIADTPLTLRDVQIAGGTMARCLTRGDLDAAVEAARKTFSDSIGAPKIPNVTWDDVGGLSNVKDAITETIQLPLERPEMFARGMKKRSGILFYGPPGTGKTLLAKAIATEYSLNFFSVKGPELLNMYIGESEANVRRVFQRARDARPCVVFFDELDSVAPKRGNQGDSGGVMDRIVSQLLAELDGMSSGDSTGSGGVFVIGATNRPDLLDPALLRPGRFDKMLYLGVSDTHEKQLTILQALTRKFTLDPTLSLRSVANQLPLTYTGADFYALCSDAMLKAVTRQAQMVDSKIQHLRADMSTAYFFDHHATPEDLAVVVTEQDFLAAQQELVPSVSQGELQHYEKVRATFEGSGEKKADKGKGKAIEYAVQDKGKGKAAEYSYDDGEANGTVRRKRDKGKGKAIAGFEDGTASDDDGLY
ncbi:peroxisomal biogenesis factor 6 [Emericellopsis atlantica]|uniref:Peroxisomal ATPase PEX6 n=1 Tax=Emericellopsis atlantica TaxID=2614577 RepID=A0A9P7ZJ95_9HYPO|nr:peroxisomal biogenesis factor 6 [Emericellopsis atlantica]KAG9252707.1 peroxisomal biogenesis factor 6 [Emericellopsis atlantica]